MRLLLPCWTLWAGSESRSHLLSRRAGRLRREMGSGEQCASADDCTSAASVDTAGPWRSPPGTRPSGACLLLSLPGRRGYGRWWWGHGFRATAPVSCSLPSPLAVLFYFLHPGPGWSHVLGTPEPGLPVTQRGPTVAAAMAFLWALVSNTGPVGGGMERWPQAQRVSRRPRVGEVGRLA